MGEWVGEWVDEGLRRAGTCGWMRVRGGACSAWRSAGASGAAAGRPPARPPAQRAPPAHQVQSSPPTRKLVVVQQVQDAKQLAHVVLHRGACRCQAAGGSQVSARRGRSLLAGPRSWAASHPAALLLPQAAALAPSTPAPTHP